MTKPCASNNARIRNWSSHPTTSSNIKQEVKAVYDYKVAVLGKLEWLSERGEIELVYTDAARVSVNAIVPYGWQFSYEDVFMQIVRWSIFLIVHS